MTARQPRSTPQPIALHVLRTCSGYISKPNAYRLLGAGRLRRDTVSVALTLFHQLCDVGNALEQLRELHAPGSDDWCACTDIIIGLDAAIDTLVHQ